MRGSAHMHRERAVRPANVRCSGCEAWLKAVKLQCRWATAPPWQLNAPPRLPGSPSTLLAASTHALVQDAILYPKECSRALGRLQLCE